MSDFDKVEKYVTDNGYQPQNLPMNQYVATILLHLDGICEDEDIELSVDDFLERFSEYGRFEDYDY